MSHPSPLVSPGPQSCELTARALARAAELVGRLGPEQLVELAAGRADLVYRPALTAAAAVPAARSGDAPHPAVRTTGVPAAVDGPAPARRAFDVDAAVCAINALSSREEVDRWLAARDRELTVPVLREVARRLGPTVSAAATSKAGLKRNIVEGTAGFRERSRAMSGGGAWRR
ncbi:MAG TPA: hypothetical protein VF109_10485 [Mycobacteriales bacterium]